MNGKIYEIKSYELSLEEINKRKLFHVYVIGLPRSGTSCMTHICELLGVKMFHTSEEQKYKYPQFEEYHPNPTGFYEVTKDVLINYMQILGTPYSGCKMIIPTTGIRWELICSSPSRVILMHRNPEEIRQSQEAFYSKYSDIDFIKSMLVQQRLWLQDCNIPFIAVNYRDVVKKTANTIKSVAKFIDSEVDLEQAIKFVNPDLYRFDIDKIAVNA